jgi:GNAT superfamily N-acetyltransferase
VLSVRAAQRGDELAVAAVHVRSWQLGYRDLLPHAYLNGLRAEDRAARYTFDRTPAGGPVTIVALDGDAIRGFATLGQAAGETGRVPGFGLGGPAGELLALYVDPPCWGRGIGRRLIAESRCRLSAHGFAEALVWVLAGNERAERFYRADGWIADGARRGRQAWGVTVDERRYRRAV